MPALSAAQLDLLRSQGHRTDLYLIIQQPMYRLADAWAGYIWSCRINGAPAGAVGDLIAALTVNLGDAGPADLYDGMTVFVGSTAGAYDRGIFYIRGDQLGVNAGTNTLNIGATAEIVSYVWNGDYVTVLNAFRIWRRDPRITEAGGVLTWYKDYNLTYNALGATAAQRMQASLPPVPILGPDRVAFINPGSDVGIGFDWSDSYATYPGAATNDWDAWGEDGGAGWNVNNDETPPHQTYSNISGLAGYRVRMEVGHNVHDSPVRFRRGMRFVFTLRRPGQTQAGDPPHAEPITDFTLQNLSGAFDQGSWRATISLHGDQAHEYLVMPGALVILFAEDRYGGSRQSIGPVSEVENVLFIGRVADGSIQQDSESGAMTFDAISAAEVALKRESYPVAVEHNNAATEWYQVPDLTVDRAAWHYLIWHSTISLVCDYYQSGDTHEIAAQDFVTGSLYETVDNLYRERVFGRFLCDRYERVASQIDRQMAAAAGGTTIWTLQEDDWIGTVDLKEIVEPPASTADLAGVHYNDGAGDAYMSHAPGDIARQWGRPIQATYLAISGQAELNTLSGRMLAYANNLWPTLAMQLAGNWRYMDIWPQEYVNISLVTERHTFVNDLFIVRDVSFAYDAAAGVLRVGTIVEYETDGLDGNTVEIPPTPPAYSPPNPERSPVYPPGPWGGGIDAGRRIIATSVGVFVTDNIGATIPVWYGANTGLATADDLYVTDIKRDPFHWWTSGGTERTLWAITETGVWKQENFPNGTWVNEITLIEIGAATGHGAPAPGETINFARIAMSAEVEDRYAIFFHGTKAWFGGQDQGWVAVCSGGNIINATLLDFTGDGMGYGQVYFAPHGGGNTIYACSNNAPWHAIGSRAYLWRSNNGGGTWNQIDGPYGFANSGFFTSISVPYVNAGHGDADVFWSRGGATAGAGGISRASHNGGVTFANITGGSGWAKLGTGGYPDYIWCSSDRPDTTRCQYSQDGDASYTTLPLVVGALQCDTSHVVWEAGQLKTAVIGGFPTAGAPGQTRVYYWSDGLVAWLDKTGNLEGFGVHAIRAIERDSMGAA